MAPLIKYCKHYDERFPLIVARAACMHLTHSSHLTKSSPSTHRAKDAAKAGYPQGDVWQVQLWQSWSKSGAHPWQQACTAPSCLPKCPVLPVSCAQYRLHLSASLDSHAQCPSSASTFHVEPSQEAPPCLAHSIGTHCIYHCVAGLQVSDICSHAASCPATMGGDTWTSLRSHHCFCQEASSPAV